MSNEVRRFPDWWWDASRAGGWLAASGSHAIDQIRVWLGEIGWVSADLVSLARGCVNCRSPRLGALTLDKAPKHSSHHFGHLELGPYTRLCESFRDAILAGAESAGASIETDVELANFEDGLAHVRVIEAARRSREHGQSVRGDEVAAADSCVG